MYAWAYLYTTPLFIPVPALDRHIVTSRQDETERGVYCQTSNIIRMSFKRSDLFSRRNVVDP